VTGAGKHLAFIPARGGSKRLTRKNILPIRGKPMLAWAIEVAVESGLFSDVVVSTEDAEIAGVALERGASVDRRPERLASDPVPIVRVLEEFIERRGVDDGALCVLIANCPFRAADDVRQAFERFRETGATATISVVRYDWRRPEWALKHDGPWLRPGWAHEPTPLQRPQPFVCPTGAVRWIDVGAFRAKPVAYPERLSAFEVPWWRGLDIDDEEDLVLAGLVAFALERGYPLGT